MAEAPGKERLSLPYYKTVLFEYNHWHWLLASHKAEFKTDSGALKQTVATI